jgi:UDP-N-acetylmuramoylalanine--D-glutamate ligase
LIDFGKNFFVYGLGVSGISVIKFLRNYKYNFKAYDDDINKIKLLKKKEICKKEKLLKILKEVSYICISPSISIKNHPILFKFKHKIILDLDILGSLIEKENNVKTIGITGTEGKSSVGNYLNSTLIKKNKSILLGNIGKTILQKKNIHQIINSYDYIIFELSSYQLDKVKYLKLNIGCITNLYPDHLKYHLNFKKYIKTKLSIKNLLKIKGRVLIDPVTLKVIDDQKFKISNKFKIYKIKKISLTNVFINENMSLVFEIMSFFGHTINLMENININNLPFRNQIIVNTRKLKIYNDSKSTNILNSIKTFNLINSNSKILILGGLLKKINLEIPKIKNSTILIFGKDMDKFHQILNHSNSNIVKFLNLKDLVIFLSHLINASNITNYVLFSPGGESFDFYENFSVRGNHFNKLVKKYLNES